MTHVAFVVDGARQTIQINRLWGLEKMSHVFKRIWPVFIRNEAFCLQRVVDMRFVKIQDTKAYVENVAAVNYV